MSYSTSKSNYPSLKYRRRGARQTRSYENTPGHQENAAEHQDTSLLPPKFRSSSLRLPHTISHNLISLVSRFEALDALSLPFKHSSPQLGSLRGLQNSSARRVGADASHYTNLSTIFFPSMNRSPLGYPHIFSEDNLPSGRDDIFISSSSPLRLSSTKLNSRYIGKAQSSSKPNSTRLHSGEWDACQATASKISKARNEGPNNKHVRRPIRDIIKLYDGSESNSLSLGSNLSESKLNLHILWIATSRGSTTQALNSFISSLTPMTPTTAKYPSDNQKQLSTSTGNKTRNFASTQADVPTTPAKYFQSTAS